MQEHASLCRSHTVSAEPTSRGIDSQPLRIQSKYLPIKNAYNTTKTSSENSTPLHPTAPPSTPVSYLIAAIICSSFAKADHPSSKFRPRSVICNGWLGFAPLPLSGQIHPDTV